MQIQVYFTQTSQIALSAKQVTRPPDAHLSLVMGYPGTLKEIPPNLLLVAYITEYLPRTAQDKHRRDTQTHARASKIQTYNSASIIIIIMMKDHVFPILDLTFVLYIYIYI